jgi:hypothetical protein
MDEQDPGPATGAARTTSPTPIEEMDPVARFDDDDEAILSLGGAAALDLDGIAEDAPAADA